MLVSCILVGLSTAPVVFSPFGSRGYIAWFVYTFENSQVTHAVLGKVDIEVTSYAYK